MDEIRLLGSGGYIPSGERETCCTLLRHGAHALVIDAGTGMRHLVTSPELLDGVRELDLVLTHFHLDHVVGLGYLSALPGPQPAIWGPGDALYSQPTQALVQRLFADPLLPFGLESAVRSIGELGIGAMEIGPFVLRTRRQERHAHPTLGLRVGDELAFCTDTAHDPASADLAAGARVLCHEAWFTADAPDNESSHSSGAQAADVAARAGVDKLALVHLKPTGVDHSRLLAEARQRFESTVLGADLLVL